MPEISTQTDTCEDIFDRLREFTGNVITRSEICHAYYKLLERLCKVEPSDDVKKQMAWVSPMLSSEFDVEEHSQESFDMAEFEMVKFMKHAPAIMLPYYRKIRQKKMDVSGVANFSLFRSFCKGKGIENHESTQEF